MKHTKLLTILALGLAVFSCRPKDPEPAPKVPQAPVIQSASLKGVNGEAKVKVGAPVKFTAEVSVVNSTLETYTVEVKKDGAIIASAGGVLEGTKATIEETLELDIDAATLAAEFTPSVYIKVTNADEQYAEKTLAASDVVSIFPPELLPQMYILDNAGHVYELSAMTQKGRYRTYVDISEIGSSLTVAEKITADNTADGQTWTFNTPVSDKGLKYIGYDAVSGELFWMINHTVTLDRTKMATDGPYNVFWSQELIPNCEVVFLNYADNLLLQSDRFADVEDNKARYTGNYSEKFEVYYIADEKTNWLTVKGQWSDNSVIWVTGENASAPMSPYCEVHPLNWFAGNPDCAFSALTLVKETENVYSVVMYMKPNFGIKLYDYWSWANELAWTSTTPDTIVISPMEEDPETGKVDGNYGNAGPSFTEGLWKLSYNKLSKEVSLEKYNGRIADPVKGGTYVPDPDDPDDPNPPVEGAPLYLVDNTGASWAMSLASGTKYITDAATSDVGTSFVFAEKLTAEGAIDWSGKVYGKDGEIAEGGSYIDLDAAYAKQSTKPWMIYYDTASHEVVYKEGIWADGMGDLENGTKVIWVQTLPHNAEVHFFGFEKPVSKMVNRAVFDSFDDAAGVARYIGVSENYEIYYRPEQGWIILSNNICAKQMLLIGKNASFGQEPYTEFPIIETDIPRVAGQTLPLNRLDEHNYSAYIYMAENASFQLYTDYSWGALNNTWESATPGIVTRENFYAKLGAEFYPGEYQITYNDEANTFTLVAKSPKPAPKPLESLYLVNDAGTVWNMSVVSGLHFCTNDSAAEVGTSFVFAEKVNDGAIDWSARVYGMKDGKIAQIVEGGDYIPIDPAYATYNKKPWKIGFDADAMEVVYREGIWKSGFGDLGNGTSVIWVQTLPHNAEVFFYGFDKPIAQMVNLAVFDRIDEVNVCARYIGVSENYEMYFRPEQGWIILTNNICAKQKLLIGKNASFGQAPYTEFPIIETDIPRLAGQTLPLNRIDEDTYSAYIYMAADSSFQLYTDYTWGSLNSTWESSTPGIVTRENFYAKLGAEFTPGLYQVTYKESANTFSLTAK